MVEMENGSWFGYAQFQLAKEQKDRWSYVESCGDFESVEVCQ